MICKITKGPFFTDGSGEDGRYTLIHHYFTITFCFFCRQVREMRRRIQDFDKESMEVQKEVGKVRNEIATLNRTANADVRKLAARLESVVNMVCY